jgi:hypothetical protein
MFAGNTKKQGGETLEDFMDLVFPRPTSYRLVWSDKSASKPLFIWRPVPRNELFQAVGVVCTLTPQEPSTNEVRTIPRQWLARELVDIKDRSLQGLTWRDSGRRVWAQELLSTMDADKEGNSDVFCMWQILSQRFFLASQKQQQPPPKQALPTGPATQARTVNNQPGDLLLDSPTGAKNLIPINATSTEFSLLDSPVNAARRQQQHHQPSQSSPHGDSLI